MTETRAGERVGWRGADWIGPLLAAGVVCSFFSIFLSGVMLGLSLCCWFGDCWLNRRIVLRFPPFTPFLLVFVGLVLVSILFSPEPLTSLPYLKKFLKFVTVFLLFTYLRRSHIEKVLAVLAVVLGASAGWGILEYLWLKDVTLLNRIDGFMSHWMTFSGQVMMGTVVLAGYLALVWWKQRRERWLGGVLLGLLLMMFLGTIVLTQTRGAWMGVLVGVGLLLIFTRPYLLAILGVAVVAGFFLLPTSFQQRFYSSFDVHDTTTKGRLDLLRTGGKLIAEHPITGVGPRMVYSEALKLRSEREIPAYAYQHLHNNVVQIGAEVGLPALVAWLGLWLKVLWDFFVMRRSEDRLVRFLALAGICSIGAFQAMGLVEYNFGDSEVVILLLFLVTIPYIAARRSSRVGGEC